MIFEHYRRELLNRKKTKEQLVSEQSKSFAVNFTQLKKQ